MATLKTNTANGGTNGTAVTTSNSGGASGDAWGAVNGGAGVWTFSSAQTVKGGMAYACTQASGTGADLQMDFASAVTEHYGRAYFYFTSFATASNALIRAYNSSFTELWRIDITATGQIRTRDASQIILNTSTQTVTTGAWWRFEWHVITGGGTSGLIEVKVFSGDSTTAAITYTNSACNTGTATDHIFFGPSLSTPQMPTLYLDEVDTDSSIYPGPANTVNQAPTANAGPDQSVVENTTVTLDGTASSDSDGTIASYSWTQTGGTTVSLSSSSASQPTFTAPLAPATLVFQLTVTDNGGLTGTDTVTINVGSSMLRYNTAQGGTNGTSVTAGNSGGSSGNAWNAVTGTNAWTYSNTNVARGTLGYKCTQNPSEAATLTWDVPALGEYYGRAYFYFTGFPSASQVIIRGFEDDQFSQEAGRIDLTTTGQLRLRDANTSILTTLSPALLTGVWYRLEWHIIPDPLNGTFEFKVFTADQTTALASYSNAACNTSTATNHIQFGPGFSTVQLPAMYTDELALNTAGWIGSALGTPLNSPPTANAGPDQNVSTSASVSLNGSASSDPDGTVASYSWSQTSGTTVSLSSTTSAMPTFTAPSSAGTLIFQLIVTDNSGATGTDTVTINVLANVIFQNTAEGGSNGTALTTSNTGGASGNAFTAVTGGTNVWTFSSARSVRGNLSIECSPLTSTAAALQWQPSAIIEHYGRMYVYLSAYATASVPLAKGFSSGFVNAWRFDLNASGKLVVRNAASTVLYTGSTGVSVGVWYRLEWHIVSSSTVGKIEARLYVADQSTLFDSYSSGSTANSGPETSAVQFGPSLGASPAPPSSWYDELAIGSAAGSWLGIAPGTPLNQAPTANAGPDDTAEPGSTYTLQGNGTDDGMITGYTWAQTAGPTVVLSDPTAQNPTFTVPSVQGGASVTFGLIVTDDGGLTSTQDTVTITALTPTLFFARGGTWQPS